MSIREERWPAGTPCWVALDVPDFARTHRLYGGILGWTFTEPTENLGGYHEALAAGQHVAGLTWDGSGRPQEWLVYLASDDVAATVEAVRAHGGTVDDGPHAVGDSGSFATCTDPTGARFGVWQAATHVGQALVDEPGAPMWMDLITDRIEEAKDFYAAVFGYTYSDESSEGTPYVMVSVPDGERPAGGIGQFGDAGSRWTVCFQVSDVDAAVARLPELGGTVFDPPHDIEWGRLASSSGPDGEKFYLLTPRHA